MESHADDNIMVFRPTMEEFKDFNRYIHYMESQGAHKAGIAKIIPPKEWVPRKCYDNIDNFVIPAPINQVVNGQKGLFTQYNIQKKPMNVKEFRRLTNLPRYEPPFHESYDDLERIYWKNITFNPPIYGADISGTLYDKGIDIWNIGHLNTLLDVIELQSGVKIEGVNTAYLYFGMWKTTFAWHTEDMDLYSINYVHFGAPKSWYGIPPEHGKRLERLAAGFFPNSKANCSSFLRHKMTLISPSILRQYGIPVKKITQEAGEIMITFPYSYHAGFNHGYNCAESTNFASERWVNYGKKAEKCTCKSDTVTIDMDIFVKIFQPERYKQWKADKKSESVKFLSQEIPNAPSLTQPYISWKEKFKLYRKMQESMLGKKEKQESQEKMSEEGCSSLSKSSSKSPSKKNKNSKKTKARRQCSGVIPLSESEPSCDDNLEYNQCLFDRVKKRSRNLGSTDHNKNNFEKFSNNFPRKELNLNQVNNLNGEHSRKLSPRKVDVLKSSCTVKCETIEINSMPVKVFDSSLNGSKDLTKTVHSSSTIRNNSSVSMNNNPTEQTGKRRLPISTKTPKKKICSNVLLKEKVKEKKHDIESNDLATTSEKFETKSATFKEEREYNSLLASLEPYCAVCSIFKPQHETPQTNITCISGLPSKFPSQQPHGNKTLELRTKPLIEEVSFASSVTNACPLAVCQLLDAEGKSPFLQCCVCLVKVHMSCYGIAHHQPGSNWTCDRCMQRNWGTICCLCHVRGGALKVVNGEAWAHIVCAISIPEVYFEQTIKRSNINISNIPTKRLKLKCCYCKKPHGVCVQCCTTRCTTSFHITCAHAAGIPIEPGNWPFSVYVYCHEHIMEKIHGKIKEACLPLEEGESVVAKHKNSKYYYCVVVDTKQEKLYHVNFRDNSWSDNLLPQDIVSHNVKVSPPEIGTAVEVKWTDGQLYDADYKGFSTNEVVQVEFLDGLMVDLDRSEIFVEKEGIPRKIQKKLRTSKPLTPK